MENAKGPPNIPENYDSILPLSGNRILARSNAPPLEIETFLDVGANVNIIRSVGPSLRCVSSGINSYASFCALLRRHSFPPTEANVLRRGAIFAPGRALRNYPAHLRKGCQVAGSSLEWGTLAAKSAADGLKNARKGASMYHDSRFSADIFRIINFIGRGRIFPQLIFI